MPLRFSVIESVGDNDDVDIIDRAVIVRGAVFVVRDDIDERLRKAPLV